MQAACCSQKSFYATALLGNGALSRCSIMGIDGEKIHALGAVDVEDEHDEDG